VHPFTAPRYEGLKIKCYGVIIEQDDTKMTNMKKIDGVSSTLPGV
jgi:hypothetical protein